MSTLSPASNEERAIATVFHQPSAPPVQHPITPGTHGVISRAAADILSHINAARTVLAAENAAIHVHLCGGGRPVRLSESSAKMSPKLRVS